MADFQIDPNDPGFLTRFYRKMMGLPETYGGATAAAPVTEGAVKTPTVDFKPINWGAGQQMPSRGQVETGKNIAPSYNPDDVIPPDIKAMLARRGPDANMAPRTGMEQKPFRMPTRPGQERSGPTPTPPRRDEGMHKVWYGKPSWAGKDSSDTMRRIGIGDTPPPGVDPESYELEPNKMTGFQRFVRGAYDVDESGSPVSFLDLFKKKAEGGSVEHASRIAGEKSTPCHTGIIHMAVGGRTDHLPMNVLEGSYVLPADVVSGLGEGNTLAGGKILDNMFSGKVGPGGSRVPEFRATPKFPDASRISPEDYNKYLTMGQKAGQAIAGKQETELRTPNARGGTITSHNRRPVPIVAAGGEYVISPDDVMNYGEGDLDSGHEKLDNFVKFVRANTVKTLRKLPGPRKD